jgi:FKBP-type peptidyl-prolyl cis-trans isomerase FkpA
VAINIKKMKHMLLRLFLFIAIVGMFSCSQGGGDKMQKAAASGYEYVVYYEDDGQQAKVGDQFYFNMDIFDDKDSLLQTYRGQKVLPSMKILELDDPNRAQNAIVDVLADLSVGDSVGLRVPIDSVQNLPPGFDDVEYLEYRLVAEEILSPAEFEVRTAELQAEQAAEMDRLKMARESVVALADKSIKDYKAGKLDLKTTARGVKYHIHEMGTGIQPAAGMMSAVLYYGALVSDGSHFDDAFQRGRAYPFRLGSPGVIEGWQEVGMNFPKGTKASVFIPSELGYGATGSPPSIPGGAELYFYMEIEDLYL